MVQQAFHDLSKKFRPRKPASATYLAAELAGVDLSAFNRLCEEAKKQTLPLPAQPGMPSHQYDTHKFVLLANHLRNDN